MVTCMNRVQVGVLTSRNHDSHTLHQVTQHVDKCSMDVDVNTTTAMTVRSM